jgi:hypothetical protein
MKVDIVKYMGSKGYHPRAIGNVYRTLCPFPEHQERTPSFTLYPADDSFYCFGCHQNGSVLKLMKLFGDPIPQELIDAERDRRAKEAFQINVVQKNRLFKIQSIVGRIRRARPHYRNQKILNQRVRKLITIVKEMFI